MRPNIRIPIWLAVLVPLGAYAVRAVLIRGGDWRPDLPVDAIVFGMLAVVIGLVGFARIKAAEEEAERRAADPSADQRDECPDDRSDDSAP